MPKRRKPVVSEAEQTVFMNTELRQFALLQLEMLAQEVDSPRLWAALYAVQAMDNGPKPPDWNHVINAVKMLDQDV